jgi:4-alpha-glucanotransferase
MLFEKDCGVLLHPSSLPGDYGIGEIGQSALDWISALKEMKQNLWQILPLGPTGYGESPYQPLSSFANNTLLIGLDELVQLNLISKSDLIGANNFNRKNIDFDAVIPWRKKILYKAASNFSSKASKELKQNFEEFVSKSSSWLNEYALFSAIKNSQNLKAWVEWPVELRTREANAIKRVSEDLSEQIQAEKVLQFLFDYQWKKVRKAASEANIRIIGDVPIFVAHDSADVWSRPELFLLDQNGQPTVVAGVPPDYFSATGQRWGNPHYNWEVHIKENFAWWLERIQAVLNVSDIVRIDHFRGFAAAWQVPASEPTAINGQWVDTPGDQLLSTIKNHFGEIPIVAELLGIITPDVEALRAKYDLPDLRVLQFAFGDDDPANIFHPNNYVQNCVAYSGTHDNDTTVGWFNSKAGEGSTRSQEDIDQEKNRVLKYTKTDGSDIQWDFIKILLQSKAGAVIYPLQDILGLGSEARINTPATMGTNWRWRFEKSQLTKEMKNRLGDLVSKYR